MGNAAIILTNRRGYSRLFTAGLINGIGDRFSGIAMLALVLHLTGSGMAVGISLSVRMLPYLFLAPLGGMLGSKLPRKYIMMTTDILRVPVALSFLWVDGENKLWLLYAGSFLLAAGEAIYSPIRKSTIPLLVKRDALLTVNGLEQLMTGCVLILGAFSGGVVSLWFGPKMAFIMNAASFLVAALLIYGIDFKVSAASEEKETLIIMPDKTLIKGAKLQRNGVWQSIALLIAGSLTLQIVLGYELLVPLTNALENVLISVYAIQVFHAGDIGVGAFYAALGIGLSLSFFAGRYLKRGLLFVALTGLLMEGFLLMGISTASNFTVAFFLYIVLSLTGGIGNVCLDTLLMRETPPALQPVLFGIVSAVGNTLMGLSMLVTGWLLDAVEPRMLGFAGGAGVVAITLLLWGYTWVRRKKDGSFTVPWKSL